MARPVKTLPIPAPPPPAPGSSPVWEAVRTVSFRNLIFAALLALLAAGTAGALSSNERSVYRSDATLLIDQPKLLVDSKDEGVIRKLNLLRLKYSALASTTQIAKPVATQLGLSEGEVAGSVGGFTRSDSLLFFIASTTSKPSNSQRIAQAVAERLVGYAEEEQGADGIPDADRYHLQLIEGASPAVQLAPTKRRAIQASVAVGLVTLGAFYVLLQLATAGRRMH